MINHCIFIITAILTATVSYGQKLGDYYVSIPIDSTQDCRLKFLNDTAVEISNVPRHMSGRIAIVLSYRSTDTSIDIFPSYLNRKDSSWLNSFGLNYFTKTVTRLTKISRGFIDYNRSLIFVREQDFGHDPDIVYVIDGKKAKTNKALQKRLKNIDKNNITVEVLKGLNAYQRFGIKGVYGVIVITTK